MSLLKVLAGDEGEGSASGEAMILKELEDVKAR